MLPKLMQASDRKGAFRTGTSENSFIGTLIKKFREQRS